MLLLKERASFRSFMNWRARENLDSQRVHMCLQESAMNDETSVHPAEGKAGAVDDVSVENAQ